MDKKNGNVEHQKVIIVGAGISGFGAASRLLENDITSFKVLEAEDRIGGRIYSVQFGDKFVDLGAEYVHGEEGNVVHQLAKDVLKESPNEMGWKLYYSNTDKSVDDLLVEFFTQIYELEKDPGSPDITLCEAFTKRFETEILPKYKGDKEMEKIAKDFIKTAELIMLTLEGSFDWREGRSKFHNFRLCPGNEVQPWSGLGYQEIFNVIKRKIGKEKARLLESRIHLNTTVTKIAIRGKEDKKIHVECEDGTKYTADHVIFTASVGVLKHDHEKMFEPKLDDVKVKAIQAMGIGGIFKVALEFTERWWKDEGEVYLIWSEEDEKKLFKEVPFGPTKDGEHWMSGFHCISNTANEKVITVWFAGHLVPEIEEMSDQLLKKGIMYGLNKFFVNHKNIPEPVHMIRSKWVTNPHFRGSFSYESMDIVKFKNSPQRELMEPVTDENGVPRILFAGEALHQTRFSTADGALTTGYTQADRIINYMNNQKSNKN